MRKAYLTIDDTPSAQTDALCTYLSSKNVPALLFCRGDRLSANLDPAVRAIQSGFVLGNHAYSHRRFSTFSFEEGIEEIEKTETLIEKAYMTAGVRRPGKYFRFPHMDRGCGGWVIDFDKAGPHRTTLEEILLGGLNADKAAADEESKRKKMALQNYLRAQGFVSPFGGDITHEWYAQTEMAQAIDAMFTFSTADWMLTTRHKGKWPYKAIDDLKSKIDNDLWLARDDSAHIILAHDQDDLLEVVRELIDYLLGQNICFQSF